jgi:hypothetical protein
MLRNAIFRSEIITRNSAMKKAIKMAVLCLLIMGTSMGISFIMAVVTDSTNARANNLAQPQEVASAEMHSPAPVKAMAGERHGVAELGKVADRQNEPLMLLLFGTMLMSIGAAIKLVMTRNPR